MDRERLKTIQRRRQRAQFGPGLAILCGWIVMSILFRVGNGSYAVIIAGGAVYIVVISTILWAFQPGRILNRLMGVSKDE